MANGRAPHSVSLRTIADGPATGTGAGATAVDLWTALAGTETLLPRTHLELRLDVSALTGTDPSLAVTIEHSHDNSIFETLGTFTAITSARSVRKVFGGARRYVRARWAVTGSDTPTVTFGVTGEAKIVYATPADLDNHGIPSKALVDLTDEQKAMAALACSALVDGRLPGTMDLPLSKWDEDLTAIVCDLMTWRLLRRRGFKPDSDVDQTIRQAFEDAMSLLRDVQTSRAEISAATDATPTTNEGSSFVAGTGSARRSWRDW